jgi:hypothetical protein
MPKCPIEYSLAYFCRYDEDAKAWVGYLPALRLYSQAKDEKRLRKALHQLIVSFVSLCHERGILDDVMHERGLKKRSHREMKTAQKRQGQYIAVGSVERELYAEVPIMLLAGKQETLECHR